jgi:hypothetical protein
MARRPKKWIAEILTPSVSSSLSLKLSVRERALNVFSNIEG